MSIDGEAWKAPEAANNWFVMNTFDRTGKRSFKRHINPFYTRKYGMKKFGMVNLPTSDLVGLLPNYPDVKANDLLDNRSEIWPVILDLTEDSCLEAEDVGVIQDGWH